MVKLSVLLLFNAMLVGLNALVMVGGLATVRVAVLLAAPVPPLVELTAPVVLGISPVCAPVTFTAMVHEVPGVAMLPPVRLMLELRAVAVTIPPQVLLTPGVPATCSPFVNVSVCATPLSDVALAAGVRIWEER